MSRAASRATKSSRKRGRRARPRNAAGSITIEARHRFDIVVVDIHQRPRAATLACYASRARNSTRAVGRAADRVSGGREGRRRRANRHDRPRSPAGCCRSSRATRFPVRRGSSGSSGAHHARPREQLLVNVAHQHERRGAMAETFADIRTARLWQTTCNFSSAARASEIFRRGRGL
jgi:hypothetical protein